MGTFRICKNKYGWFKLQLWYPPKKVFFITLKGKWKDTCFSPHSRHCDLFKTIEEAEKARQHMIETDEKSNKEWECYN